MSSTLAETFVDQLVMKKIYSLVGSRYFCCSKKKIRERERERERGKLSSTVIREEGGESFIEK